LRVFFVAEAMCGFRDNVQKQSGNWTMTGKVPVARRDPPKIPATIGRMDAIQNTRAMAGSPDADFATSRTASCRLAHGFCVLDFSVFGRHVLREPMKET
jgi:hypothetical protein